MTKEDYFKYYIQGTDHYLIPKDVFNELFNEMSNWREEAKELKKQLEESDFKIANLTMDKIELKKQLEDLQETHYLIQGGRSNGKTYLMKLQADKEQLNSLVNSCQEEIRRLKKQLEEKENIACDWKDSCLENAGKIEILENQQKEFIDYMENKIYSIEPKGTGINYNCEYDSEEDFISAMEEQSRLNTLKEILSKFKEIIVRTLMSVPKEKINNAKTSKEYVHNC